MRKSEGITLIALVITIAILLILAGVTITILTSSNFITKAKSSRTETENAETNETTTIDKYSTYIDKKTIVDDLSKTKSYVGYYADIDPTIEGPEGVIFVDLMKTTIEGADANNNETTVSGIWNNNANSKYSYTTITESKAYSITSTNYTGENAKFGEHPIISVKTGSTGSDRFYVMALNDINTNIYYWNVDYSTNSYSIGDDYREVTSTTQVAMQTTEGESIGRRNTEILMQSSELTENSSNIWNNISSQVTNGWFVPSRAEWSAFGDFMYRKIEGTKCNTSNYKSTFGIGEYWSSSQGNNNGAWSALFLFGCITNGRVYDFGSYVRLATTF